MKNIIESFLIVSIFITLLITSNSTTQEGQHPTKLDPTPPRQNTVVVQGRPAVTKAVQAQRAFESRERLKKRVVKNYLRRLARKSPVAKSGKIKRILANDDEFEMFYEGFVGQKYSITENTSSTIIDSIKDLLQFLVDNQDGLIKFIETLIDLFATTEPAAILELPSNN